MHPIFHGPGCRKALAVGLAFILSLLVGSNDISMAGEPRPVRFLSTDGISLKGYLFGKGCNGVILAHMYPADQKSWFPFAKTLAEKNYRVLTFDFRGYGESDGEKTISQIDRDLSGACRFLKPRVKKIFLIGASMGGTASFRVASKESVSGMVSLSGPVAFRGLDARSAIKGMDTPVLLIAAEGDSPAVRAAHWLEKATTSPKKLLIVPGSEHGTRLFPGPHGKAVEEAILRFLESGQPLESNEADSG